MKNKFFSSGVIISSLIANLYAHGTDEVGDKGDMMGYGMMSGGGMGFSWLILLVVGFFAYYLYDKNSKKSNKTSPKDLLDRRFANGEIDEKEYEKRKRILEGD